MFSDSTLILKFSTSDRERKENIPELELKIEIKSRNIFDIL